MLLIWIMYITNVLWKVRFNVDFTILSDQKSPSTLQIIARTYQHVILIQASFSREIMLVYFFWNIRCIYWIQRKNKFDLRSWYLLLTSVYLFNIKLINISSNQLGIPKSPLVAPFSAQTPRQTYEVNECLPINYISKTNYAKNVRVECKFGTVAFLGDGTVRISNHEHLCVANGMNN